LAIVVTSDKNVPVLVLFEDGRPEIERVARAIAERLESAGRAVAVREASASTIPEVLAAGLFVLGAESSESPSFGEIARVFKGINLAGRKAAFFGASGAAIARLKALCADTDVTVAHADLVGRHIEPSVIAAWLRGII
jgi:flavorubredoxin